MIINWAKYTSNGDKLWGCSYTNPPCVAVSQTNKDEATLTRNVTATGFTLSNNGGTPTEQWVIAIGY